MKAHQKVTIVINGVFINVRKGGREPTLRKNNLLFGARIRLEVKRER
jgi:hypothetical protein